MNGLMIRLLTDVAQNSMRTIRGKMTQLFAVITYNGMAGINVVSSFIAMTTGTGLSIVANKDQDLSKTDMIRDVLLYSDSEISHAILNMGPPFLSKVAPAMVENFTIFRQSLNDGFVWHLVWCVKNLDISKGPVYIFKRKRSATNLENIMRQELILSVGISEGQDDLPGRLTLDTGYTITVNICGL